MTTDHRPSDGNRRSLEASDGAQRSPEWLHRHHPEVSLKLSVVEYAERPDRCTIYPPGLDSIERMSTWISADRTAWTSLAAKR